MTDSFAPASMFYAVVEVFLPSLDEGADPVTKHVAGAENSARACAWRVMDALSAVGSDCSDGKELSFELDWMRQHGDLDLD